MDCVAAETALLPSVPDESQSPAAAELVATSPNESLDTSSENLHTSSTLVVSNFACPFLTSTAAPVLYNASVVSPEPESAPNSSYTSESLPNTADDDEMASDEQLEDWESDVFDP